MTRDAIKRAMESGVNFLTALDLATDVLDLRSSGYMEEAEELDSRQRQDALEVGIQLGIDSEDINELLEEYDEYIR